MWRQRPGSRWRRRRPGLLAQQGVQLRTGATWKAVHRLGLSFKEMRAAEQDRPDVAARRMLWQAAQPSTDPEALVLLDGEADRKGARWTAFPPSGASSRMARLHGRPPVGEPCRDAVPFGHWKTMTFITGLRLSGLTAPRVLDGPMDGDAFRVHVRAVLAPTPRCGDVVVPDNLPAHKLPGIREAVAAKPAQLVSLPRLPPNRMRPLLRRCRISTPSVKMLHVPGYRLKQAVQFARIGSNRPLRIPEMGGAFTGLKVSVFLEVEGAAHYPPAYAGNLDIMTSAALRTAERMALRMGEGVMA